MDPLLPGLAYAPAILLDERRRPDFRDVFGALTRRASEIAVAVTRVRLSTIDLTPDELGGARQVRVLVAEMSALQLDTEARSLLRLPHRAPNVRYLMGLFEQGRLEVRSAPLGGWSPDFSVFAGPDGPFAALVGYHAFERPYPHRGPALATVHGEDGARLAQGRHTSLWNDAHDIGPALWSILARADSQTRASATGSS